jgi:hypothetical protein
LLNAGDHPQLPAALSAGLNVDGSAPKAAAQMLVLSELERAACDLKRNSVVDVIVIIPSAIRRPSCES